MPFIYKKNLKPGGGRVLVPFTLTASETFTIGQAVLLTSGALSSAAGDNKLTGIIASFVKADGSPVTDNGAGGKFATSYAAGATTTVQAMVDVSLDSMYSVVADGTVGTTNDSDDAGVGLDAATGGLTLSETSAVAVGTTAQFFSYGEDTEYGAPTNSLLVSIQESQVKI